MILAKLLFPLAMIWLLRLLSPSPSALIHLGRKTLLLRLLVNQAFPFTPTPASTLRQTKPPCQSFTTSSQVTQSVRRTRGELSGGAASGGQPRRERRKKVFLDLIAGDERERKQQGLSIPRRLSPQFSLEKFYWYLAREKITHSHCGSIYEVAVVVVARGDCQTLPRVSRCSNKNHIRQKTVRHPHIDNRITNFAIQSISFASPCSSRASCTCTRAHPSPSRPRHIIPRHNKSRNKCAKTIAQNRCLPHPLLPLDQPQR